MKSLTAICSAAFLAVAVLPAQANGIKGTKVTSTISAPDAPGYSSDNFGPTKLTIGPGTEYDATTNLVSGGKKANAYSFDDTYSANFNGNNSILKVDDVCNAVSGTDACSHDPYDPFQMTFTDKAFTGDVLELLSGGNNYTFSLTGDTITINFDGIGNPDELKLAIVSPTPEPSSLALLGTGLFAAAFYGRRRLTV